MKFFGYALLVLTLSFGVWAIYGEAPLRVLKEEVQVAAARLALTVAPKTVSQTPVSTGAGQIQPQSASNSGSVCAGTDEAASACSSKYYTRYVTNAGPPPQVEFCKIDPKYIQKICANKSAVQCQNTVDSLVQALTETEGEQAVPGTCAYGYRGDVSCFSTLKSAQVTSQIQLAAAVTANAGGWRCCRRGSLTCQGAPNPDLFQQISTMQPSSPLSVGDEIGQMTPPESTQTIDDVGAVFNESQTPTLEDTTQPIQVSDTGQSLLTTPGDTQPIQVSDTGDIPPAAGNIDSVVSSGVGDITTVNNTDAVNPGRPNTQTTPPKNPYESLKTPKTLQKPESLIQKFVNESILSTLGNFIVGQSAFRAETKDKEDKQPRVVYVAPPQPTLNAEYKNIQTIASDVAAQTQTSQVSRVDHFAQTLNAVGGPNELDTENKSYGRLQDLIIEDEAIRALRVAEEEGKRAKTTIFCRTNETAQACDKRRDAKAKEVERVTFVAELEERVLPENAVQHFLAVYDGWVRPSPAPATYATSTLSLLNSEDSNEEEYKITTNGTEFVRWVFEGVSNAATRAISTITNLILGGSNKGNELTPQNVDMAEARGLSDVVFNTFFSEPEIEHLATYVSGSAVVPNIPTSATFEEGINKLKETARTNNENEYLYAYVTKNGTGKWVFLETLGGGGGFSASYSKALIDSPDEVFFLHTHPSSNVDYHPPSFVDVAQGILPGIKNARYGAVDRNGIWEFYRTPGGRLDKMVQEQAELGRKHAEGGKILHEKLSQYQKEHPQATPEESALFVFTEAAKGTYGEEARAALRASGEIINEKYGDILKRYQAIKLKVLGTGSQSVLHEAFDELLELYEDIGVNITPPRTIGGVSL